MLIEIRNKIERLKAAKAWLQTHLNADKLTFEQLFPDITEMLNESQKADIAAAQYVKESTSSFISFN